MCQVFHSQIRLVRLMFAVSLPVKRCQHFGQFYKFMFQPSLNLTFLSIEIIFCMNSNGCTTFLTTEDRMFDMNERKRRLLSVVCFACGWMIDFLQEAQDRFRDYCSSSSKHIPSFPVQLSSFLYVLLSVSKRSFS